MEKIVRKIGVVILNYLNYTETICCVNETLLQNKVELKIVIVENGSNNGSSEVLSEFVREKNNVELIISNKNLGYAKGNNLGIKKLLEEGIDFIVISNSDISYTNKDILCCMYDSITDSVGVVTPSIKNLNNTYELHTQYRKSFFYLRMIKNLYHIIRDTKRESKSVSYWTVQTGKECNDMDEYYALTGCFFALTPAYLKHYDFLYPNTFLYGEENATLVLTKKAGLDTKVIQTSIVLHKRGASSDSNLAEGSLKKRIMMAESAKKVLKLVFTRYKTIVKKHGEI